MSTEKQSAKSDKNQAPGEPRGSVVVIPENAIIKKKEIGGPAGPEPTRYGDWEIGGKCVDF